LPTGHETILVVEDDPLVRSFVLAQLQSLGYTTLSAARGREALAIVDGDQPFELLFTDVIMPGGVSGRQLAEAVQAKRPSVRVLYTSGYTDNAILEHGQLLSEALLLLTKPYRRAELAQMVRRALSPASPAPLRPA
ncbi:MAG: response regulator, partial [Bradyrhizobium sp.]|nr:response regulator [Bradyrhizobium sp.]